MVWTDGEWEHSSAEWKSPELLAWLFNNCANPDELVINDRWGKETRGRHGGFYTTEYGGHTQAEMSADHPWEECRGMGASFGWNRNETIDEYSTDAALIRLLADTVGRGGNLLLDIGPTGDGRIPVIMQERLIQIGAWLKTNGEAVYGTDGGPFGGAGKGRWTATTRPGKLYVHVFQRPADGLLRLPGLVNKVAKAALLDGGAAVEVKADPAGPVLTLPACLPDARVTVVVLDIEGPPRVETVPVAQGADGKVELRAADATIHGTTAKYEDKGDNIGFWSRTQDTVSWDVQVAGPGTFAVAVTWACAPGSGGEYAVTAGDAKVEAKVAETGAWATFKTENIGTLALGAGKVTVAVKPKSKKGEGLMNLRSIVLVPQK
jgi:alpha-L-fucosidase